MSGGLELIVWYRLRGEPIKKRVRVHCFHFMQFLLLILSIWSFCAQNSGEMFRISGPFLRGSDDGLQDWTMSRSVVVLQDLVRLTSETPRSSGSIWSNTANILEEWEANFDVNVFHLSLRYILLINISL